MSNYSLKFLSNMLIERIFPCWDGSSTDGLIVASGDTANNIGHFNLLMYSANLIQPSFFISRESWRLLVNGISRNKYGSLIQWMDYRRYEVYGFVFCIAFDEKKGSFFRIRTILKEKDAKCVVNNKKKEMKVCVENENVAYVDIDAALSNPRLDCMRFIDVTDNDFNIRIYDLNSRVIVKERQGNLPESFNYSAQSVFLPIGKKGYKFNNKINNEGNYFGKRRIWDRLLNQTYPCSEGTVISIASKETLINNEAKREIYFNFKINEAFDTNLPCPNPPICE